MAVSTATLSIPGAGEGTRFPGDFRQRGRIEPRLSQRPRTHGWRVSLNGLHLLHYASFRQIPRQKNLTLTPSFAVRKDADDSFLSNVEDTDEMIDGLFDKYGKVIFRRDDNMPPGAEVDDDAESLSFAVAMAKVASDVKAADITLLFVKPLVNWTRFFIIATAFSFPQINAIGSKMRDLAEEKFGKVSTGDTKPNSWTVLDFGDVVIHIFLPPQRAFYNLEEFYGNATLIELPFANEPPLSNRP